VLVNNGGNGHSVPATVPDSESHASTEIADHRLAAARGDQGKVMEYLALGPGRELMYGPRFTAAALGRVPALQAAPNMRCAGVVGVSTGRCGAPESVMCSSPTVTRAAMP
jgi:hypothetical protein